MDFEHSFSKYRHYYKSFEPFLERTEVKTYSGIILFLLTISFFIIFAIRPTLSTITFLNKQIEDAKYTDTKLQEKITALSEAQTQYNQIAGDLPVIFGSLPDNPEIPTFAKFLEVYSRSTGVTIVNLQFSPIDLYNKNATQSALANEMMVHGFSLVVSGPYKNLTAFMEIMRKIQRIATIESIKVSKFSAQNENTLSLDFTGKTYFWK